MKLIFGMMVAAMGLLFSTSAAFAWGPNGHRIVCEVAFQELNPTARAEVIRLIRTDTEYRYYYDSCNWPDDPRKRGREHYVNLPRTATNVDPSDVCGEADKCVITAILKDLEELINRSGDRDNLESIKYLGHWVGDLHQPLHVSFADDRGGNSIKEHGSCTGHLHRVWDSCILESSLGVDPIEAALDLHATVTDTQRQNWTAGISGIDHSLLASWADESFAIATSPDAEYCVLRDGGCWYSDSIDVLGPHDEEKAVRVDAEYIARNRDAVAERLVMAGIRLGALLNEAIGQ